MWTARGNWIPVVLAGTICMAALPARAEDPRQILLNSLEPRVTTYVGEQVAEVSGLGRSLHQQVYRKGSTLRIDFVETGQVMFDNGETSLLYLPRQRVVERSPSNLARPEIERRQRALRGKRSVVTQLPDDTVAGRPAYVLSVSNNAGKTPPRKVWVDKETFLQLRQDITRGDGRTLSTYFSSIRFQAEPPAEKLAFTPPPTVQVVQKGEGRPIPRKRAETLAQQWGGLLELRRVPEGYNFRGYYQHVYRGRPVLVSVYDGPGPAGARTSLSMFQGPVVGMGSMMQRKPGKLRVLAGRKGNADVMLVAPLPEEELQKVMESVSP